MIVITQKLMYEIILIVVHKLKIQRDLGSRAHTIPVQSFSAKPRKEWPGFSVYATPYCRPHCTELFQFLIFHPALVLGVQQPEQ